VGERSEVTQGRGVGVGGTYENRSTRLFIGLLVQGRWARWSEARKRCLFRGKNNKKKDKDKNGKARELILVGNFSSLRLRGSES